MLVAAAYEAAKENLPEGVDGAFAAGYVPAKTGGQPFYILMSYGYATEPGVTTIEKRVFVFSYNELPQPPNPPSIYWFAVGAYYNVVRKHFNLAPIYGPFTA